MILRQAEGMLDQSRGDIIVTAQKSEELSRPKIVQAQASPGQVKPQAKPEEKPEAKPDAKAIEAARQGRRRDRRRRPDRESGIRRHRPAIDRDRPQSSRRPRAPKREVTEPNGAKRTVRIIAPNIIPVPEARKP